MEPSDTIHPTDSALPADMMTTPDEAQATEASAEAPPTEDAMDSPAPQDTETSVANDMTEETETM
jgi:hypothetical protein